MAVEHDGEDPNDPSANALVHFGVEIAEERKRHGWSLADLAKRIPCDKSLVHKIEKAQRIPSLELAEACDREFKANGRFVRHWKWAIKYAFPAWFQRYVELEMEATSIRLFHSGLVPGLLQTEEYARTVLRAGRPRDLEGLVTLRMERQAILSRKNAPDLWIILDEEVLRREVAAGDVMRAQLERLLRIAEIPQHVVQIIPASVRNYHGSFCPYGILSFDEGADVVHVDGFPRGYLLAEPGDVSEATRAYDLLKATAHSPDKSAALINSVLKDRYS
ncbi:helix-turn-helix domain-containing protein [Streptomyces sp. 6N223]|uniref:helix-turn-helix domain-containing protein n=1 Tax=Streptomyces sp. 6N223 TaxID=3457412 RepID=UPI003FD2A3C3